MKAIAGGFGALGMWLVAWSQPAATATPAPAGLTHEILAISEELNEVVAEYCVRCHSESRMVGNLNLEGFDVTTASESAEVAEKMILKLRAEMMPPPGGRRPPADSIRALAEALEIVVDEAAAANPNPGARRFQRLNRAEYTRVISELLDLEVDAGRWLPLDTYLGNFDNLSAAQGLSTTLLEAYLRAATEVSRLAVGNPTAADATAKYSSAFDVSQHAWEHIEGTPFGTRGGMVITHDFPADGEYVLEVSTLLGRGTPGESIDISIDGVGVAELMLEHNGGVNVPIRTEPVFVSAGQHQVAAAFIRTVEGPYEDRLSPHGWSLVGGEDSRNWANYGITVPSHLRDLMITGPVRITGVGSTPSRQRVFSCYPSTPAEGRSCAESIVERLAEQAYRRPIDAEDIAGPMSFYDDVSESGGFELGVRTALQVVLASPSFVFRLEAAPAGAVPGETYRLTDVDLASRLSFFLWGAGPDEELLDLARLGALTDAEIERQVDRMLADPRSDALATRFASQWLRLQDTEKNSPEPYLYPNFTGQLRADLVRETQLLFHHLVQEDRSLLEFLSADYTFLNERLAEHYGVPNIAGPQFRRVEYPDDTRRGLLGHGSVLLLTSMANRTSPVLRGKWVMEVLMGTPPPPPPPNIPSFESTKGAEGGRVLTTRERMEEHRSNPTCNACHRLMDPIGLALDNFDVTGQWRTRENGMPLDTKGTYYDDTPVGTPQELSELLLKRPIPIVRNFAANMLAYAMGRRVEFYDQPTIRHIASEAEENGYRISSFIKGIATSDPFQMSRSPAPAAAETDQTQG